VLETIVNQINETRFTWFDSILANNIGPRPYNSTSNVQAAEFIAEELNTTKNISATYQWFTHAGKKIANVIGTLPSANSNNQSKIVVGAHFDTVPNSTGADDNGSGTALLLEVAKVLSQFKFNCTIEFVAFNAEEEGLVGSSYYVQQASQAGEDILLMINIDMCIWNNPNAPPHEKLWIVYQGTVPYENCERFADIALNISYTYTTAPIQKISSTNNTYCPVYNWHRSDHANFWTKGTPALWIFEFNGFQNPYIHTPADSMKVESYNFTLGAQAAQVVATTIALTAVFKPDTRPPTISVISPENKTYPVKDVPLTFTVSESTSWIGYCLNRQANVTISGNTTLVGLSDGTYTVTVYANDTAGNTGYSDTVYFTIDTVPSSIEILSPENRTYTTSSISLSFTFDEATLWIGYSLDDQTNVTITGNTTLTSLLDGSHHVVVYANDTAGNMGYSDTVCFTVQTSPMDTPPNISIVSPENRTYYTTDIPLTFTVNESVSWIAYSLDNKANVTITGNTTLFGLSNGSHSLIVYANDTAGNTGASETIYFNIESQEKPFQTWIVAPIVIIVVVGAALLVFRKGQ